MPGHRLIESSQYAPILELGSKALQILATLVVTDISGRYGVVEGTRAEVVHII
jgi:hypothetical protein